MCIGDQQRYHSRSQTQTDERVMPREEAERGGKSNLADTIQQLTARLATELSNALPGANDKHIMMQQQECNEKNRSSTYCI